MVFPLAAPMDEDACCARFVEILYPNGLACPRCGGDRFDVYRRYRDQVIDYRCPNCGSVFPAFTNPAVEDMSRPSELDLNQRGFARPG